MFQLIVYKIVALCEKITGMPPSGRLNCFLENSNLLKGLKYETPFKEMNGAGTRWVTETVYECRMRKFI